MKAQTHRMVDTLMDEFLQLDEQQEIFSKLEALSNTDAQLYTVVTAELVLWISKEGEDKIQLSKLLLLETIISRQGKIFDQKLFKTATVYQLVAVAKGYLAAGFNKQQNIKGPFVRNLKKEDSFWGVTHIQHLYNSLVNKCSPSVTPYLPLNAREYVWSFLVVYQDILPPGFDLGHYLLRHLLMLRPDVAREQDLFNKLVDHFLSSPYNLQNLTKNFRFGLEFFRNSYNDKEVKVHPQLALLQLLKKYSKPQLDHMFSIASLGLAWSAKEINCCIGGTIRLGITEQTYRLLKCFIQVARTQKKYNQLIQAFNNHMGLVFLFLKHKPLFDASLKTLKQLILGPWGVVSLYSTFGEKAIQYWEKCNKKCPPQFMFLISCVVQKYKEITITDDLKQILLLEGQDEQLNKQISAEIKQYDWKAFADHQKGNQEMVSVQTGENYRGIVNIGNSCYMNSFLQCLFMTKQYRRQILEVSTLHVQAQVLQKMRKMYPQGSPNYKNLPLQARQTVRPLAELQRLFSLLLKSKRPAINPTPIKNVSPVEFQNPYQHDSIEFGRFLIQSISRSEIPNIFEGQMTVQIQCPYCQAKRQKTQQFLDLMLSSSEKSHQEKEDSEFTNKSQNISHSFDHSLQEEHLDGLICEKCNNAGQEQGLKQSVKRHWVSKFPPYLVLTLKRFEYDLKQNKNVKKQFNMELSETFKLAEVEFCLYCIIVHRGASANSGHYFTFARASLHPQEKSWLCLNDSTVSKMEDFSKVLEFLTANQDDTPYILFACQEQHRQKHHPKMEQALILRPPLQSYIDKDDMEYAKSLSKGANGGFGGIDLSLLKFATGNYMKRDDEDDGNNPYGNGSGFGGNNPIM